MVIPRVLLAKATKILSFRTLTRVFAGLLAEALQQMLSPILKKEREWKRR
jgi:hypothetical protein